MRHILLTNDDGIASPGLAALAAVLEPLGRLYHHNTGLSRLVEGEDGAFVARFLNRL